MSGEDKQEQEPKPDVETPSTEEDVLFKLLEGMAEKVQGSSPEMIKVRRDTADLMKEIHAFIEKRAKELGLQVSGNDYTGKVINFGLGERPEEKMNSISVTTLTVCLSVEGNQVADAFAKGFGKVVHGLSVRTLKATD